MKKSHNRAFRAPITDTSVTGDAIEAPAAFGFKPNVPSFQTSFNMSGPDFMTAPAAPVAVPAPIAPVNEDFKRAHLVGLVGHTVFDRTFTPVQIMRALGDMTCDRWSVMTPEERMSAVLPHVNLRTLVPNEMGNPDYDIEEANDYIALLDNHCDAIRQSQVSYYGAVQGYSKSSFVPSGAVYYGGLGYGFGQFAQTQPVVVDYTIGSPWTGRPFEARTAMRRTCDHWRSANLSDKLAWASLLASYGTAPFGPNAPAYATPPYSTEADLIVREIDAECARTAYQPTTAVIVTPPNYGFQGYGYPGYGYPGYGYPGYGFHRPESDHHSDHKSAGALDAGPLYQLQQMGINSCEQWSAMTTGEQNDLVRTYLTSVPADIKQIVKDLNISCFRALTGNGA